MTQSDPFSVAPELGLCHAQGTCPAKEGTLQEQGERIPCLQQQALSARAFLCISRFSLAAQAVQTRPARAPGLRAPLKQRAVRIQEGPPIPQLQSRQDAPKL